METPKKVSKYILEIPYAIGNTRYHILYHMLYKSLIAISPTIWETINSRNFENVPKKVLSQLIELGFLVPEGIDETEVMRTLINLQKYNPAHMGIFVNLTSRCNLACPYCYQDLRKKFSSQQDLAPENWKRIMTFINSKNTLKDISIAFFGGEPLLNIETLTLALKDLETLKDSGVSYDASIITNGTLFSKEIGQELSQYSVTVQVTLDGMKEIHDVMRPFPNGEGSFDNILKNLLDNIDEFRGRIVLRMNVNEANKESVRSLLMYLRDEYGLHEMLGSVGFEYIFPTQTAIKVGSAHILDKAKSEILVELYHFAVDLGYKIGNPMVFGPCMASHAYSFAVDENLNVYKCPGFLYSEPDGYIDKMGKLIITSSRWYSLINFEPPCVTKCKFGPICYGGCKWMGSATKSGISCNLAYLKNYETLIKLYVQSKYKEILGGR